MMPTPLFQSNAQIRTANLRSAAAGARKARVMASRQDSASFARYVLKDEETGKPVGNAPMHAEWHDLANQHDRLIIQAFVESGKTQSLSIARTLWMLGKDPNRRAVIVSNTNRQATKIAGPIAGYLKDSAELKEVFPHLRPSQSGPWTSTQFTVERAGQPKDSSVQVIGVHGNIMGARIDDLILDDIMDYENTRTPANREDLWRWVHSTLFGRLSARGRVLVLANPYHREDFVHQLEKNPLWKCFRYPVLDPRTGESAWPERWPQERIERKRQELGEVEFARQLLCQPRNDASSRFKWDWIKVALDRGNGKTPTYQLKQLPSGYATYTGVDVGASFKATGGRTVLTTIARHPDGSKELLNCERGRWAGPEIVERIDDAHHRYRSIVYVESNATQRHLIQFAQERGLDRDGRWIRAFQTGANKLHPEFGVEGLATELARGGWIIPNIGVNYEMQEDIAALVDGLLYYSPEAHTADEVMSLWIASEGARKGGLRVEQGSMGIRRR